MGAVLSRRISSRVPALSRAMQRERRAYVQDTGRFVRDLARRHAPKQTRELERSIQMGPVQETEKTTYVEVGSSLERAVWHEKGTGIYNPQRRRPIVPVRAKALAWQARSGNLQIVSGIRIRRGRTERYRPRDVSLVFRRSVRGIKPVRFLERAFTDPATRSFRRQRLQQMAARIQAAGGSA